MANPAFRRILKEFEQVSSSSMKDEGIYWWFDPSNITKGKALILGPPGTPYEGCFVTFQFEFPSDYPFSPPKVTFLTCDGKTRFHPNLYIEGRVCLSILGTYSGPGWQSTMSLSMILISLKALLDANPLAHEPGYSNFSISQPIANQYAKFIQHQIIAHTLNELKYNYSIQEFEEEIQVLKPTLLKQLNRIIDNNLGYAETLYTNVVYGMRGSTCWNKLKKEVEDYGNSPESY
jgi:ubiquitin-protein ligase